VDLSQANFLGQQSPSTRDSAELRRQAWPRRNPLTSKVDNNSDPRSRNVSKDSCRLEMNKPLAKAKFGLEEPGSFPGTSTASSQSQDVIDLNCFRFSPGVFGQGLNADMKMGVPVIVNMKEDSDDSEERTNFTDDNDDANGESLHLSPSEVQRVTVSFLHCTSIFCNGHD
jgi:hypothetical protein